jgi:hypothetical protein
MKRSAALNHGTTAHKRVNGHAEANGSIPSCAAAAPNGHTELDKAGSDDASEFSAANTASLASTAGADRTATADLAESAAEGRFRCDGTALGSEASAPNSMPAQSPNSAAATSMRQGHAKAGAKPDANTEPHNPFADVPPGRKPLPVDGEAFVRAVHRQVDLVQLEVVLLRHEDEKVVQRELAYLRELRYGKRAPSEAESESTRPIIFDLPRPEREVQ